MDWNDLAEDRDKRRAPLKAVMNLRVPKNARNFLTAEELSFTEWTPLHGNRVINLFPRSAVHS